VSCVRERSQATHPKRRKGIGAHFKRRLDDPVEEAPEDAAARRRAGRVHVGEAARRDLAGAALRRRLVVQDQGGDGVELERLAQDAAAGHGALAALVAVAQGDDDLRARADEVVHGERLGGLLLLLVLRVGARGGRAVAQRVGKDELGVLAGLEGDLVDVGREEVQEVLGED
jgi:hypothetical protein